MWCPARLKVVVERMLEELTDDVNMGGYLLISLSTENQHLVSLQIFTSYYVHI